MEYNLKRRLRAARSSHRHGKPMFKRSKAMLQFLDLPEDMICKILSELPPKEIARTSVLSSKWQSVRMISPKLQFDGMTMCSKSSICGSEQYTREFIKNVNAVLKQHNGEFLKDFEFKFELNSELASHLDNWVRFAAASRAKNLAFDLVPAKFHGRNDRYLLPSEFLDSGCTSRLQHIQLGFVSVKLPSQFSGFPNLKKLDLHLINITAKDLEDMLSSCSKLEWLSIVRCHLHDELKVDLPLPRLLYLSVAQCRITRIKFNAMKLKTFEYRGSRYPIDLTQSLELKDVYLYFLDSVTLEHALTTLPALLPSVESLCLQARAPLKMPGLLENACKFSQLKYLRLELFLSYVDACNILSLASYLRAAPLLEKFELHFSACTISHLGWEPIRSLPRCPHNYLKNLYVTGFIASTGQLEFLLHALENAPVLEVLTLDPACKFSKGLDMDDDEAQSGFFSHVRGICRRYISGRISATTKLCIL